MGKDARQAPLSSMHLYKAAKGVCLLAVALFIRAKMLSTCQKNQWGLVNLCRVLDLRYTIAPRCRGRELIIDLGGSQNIRNYKAFRIHAHRYDDLATNM